MKKYILIGTIVLVSSLTALSFYQNEKEQVVNTKCQSPKMKIKVKSDFVYKVDSRFNTTVTLTQLNESNSFLDVFPKHSTENIDSLYNTEVVFLKSKDEEVKTLGTNHQFTENQLELLKSLSYSDNFYLRANFMNGNKEDYIVYYITIVPEQEAIFESDNEKLINYLQSESEEITASVSKDYLQPGKIKFTVNTHGNIRDIEIESSCGYTEIDIRMIELLNKVPGEWSPALNKQGQKVEQTLVFFYGLIGC